jgi:thiamine-phosphate diphosphorylase/hydroxyethylthiazole kinase
MLFNTEPTILELQQCSLPRPKQVCCEAYPVSSSPTFKMLANISDTKSIIGTAGTKAILESIAVQGVDIPAVAIGSINATNVQRVLHQTSSSTHPRARLSGIAVVSAIIASAEPQSAARELRTRIDNAYTTFYSPTPPKNPPTTNLSTLLSQVPAVTRKHVLANPLCHNMTGLVVQNFAANVCLATGSSPIMSNNGLEAPDLASLSGGLVINMGTVTPDTLSNYLLAMRAYNSLSTPGPIVFDPVGGGATSVRRDAIKQLLAAGFFDCIKGNENEIKTIFESVGSSPPSGASSQQRGVDSALSTTTSSQKANLVRSLAERERCIILMTGPTGYLSDGTRTVAISNGHPLLGKITGSGYALGSTIASYLAVHREDKFLAVLAAALHYEIAAERAATDTKGPGTFVPAFLDQLYGIAQIAEKDEGTWVSGAARVAFVQC